MRSLSKTIAAIGVLGAAALSVSAAYARPAHADRFGGAYNYAAPLVSSRSIPYDAGGPAYAHGQRDIDSSSDFQLQGR